MIHAVRLRWSRYWFPYSTSWGVDLCIQIPMWIRIRSTGALICRSRSRIVQIATISLTRTFRSNFIRNSISFADVSIIYLRKCSKQNGRYASVYCVLLASWANTYLIQAHDRRRLDFAKSVCVYIDDGVGTTNWILFVASQFMRMIAKVTPICRESSLW